MATGLEDAGWIEWRDEQGRRDLLAERGWPTMQVAHLTEAGRAAAGITDQAST
jgi:hypothetical protein